MPVTTSERSVVRRRSAQRSRSWVRRRSRIWPASPRGPTRSSSVCSPTSRCGRSAWTSDLGAAMAPGAVLVIHTTGSPRTAETIAARGIDVVDAPVSGGPHDIAAGHVTLFVGGDDDAVARVKPVLSAYGDPILHVGRTGAGQLVKLVNNTLFAAQIGRGRRGRAAGRPAGHRGIRAARSADARQRRQLRTGQDRDGGLLRRLHRQRSATSSARTSRWPARWWPSWAATSVRWTTWSAPGWRVRHDDRIPRSLLWKRHYR